MTTPIDLATVSGETFRPFVGAEFEATLPSGTKVAAKLASVDVRTAPAPGLRASFSLVFEVPRSVSPGPDQGSLVLVHPGLGTLEVFGVALQPRGDFAYWQIVFG